VLAAAASTQGNPAVSTHATSDGAGVGTGVGTGGSCGSQTPHDTGHSSDTSFSGGGPPAP